MVDGMQEEKVDSGIETRRRQNFRTLRSIGCAVATPVREQDSKRNLRTGNIEV